MHHQVDVPMKGKKKLFENQASVNDQKGSSVFEQQMYTKRQIAGAERVLKEEMEENSRLFSKQWKQLKAS